MALRNTADAGSPDIAPFVFAPGSMPYPVVGDWDGDGPDTVGVKERPVASTWRLSNSNVAPATDVIFDYGEANDLPLSWR